MIIMRHRRRSTDIGRLTIGWLREASLVPTNTFLTLSWVRDQGRIIGLSGSVAHRAWYAFLVPPPPPLTEQLLPEGGEHHGSAG